MSAEPLAPHPPEANLPPEGREAFAAFRRGRSAATLRDLVIASIREFSSNPAAVEGTPAGTSRLIEDLALDSLAVTELLFRFEDLFEVRITNEEVMKLKTLDDLVAFLAKRLNVAAA